MSKEGEDRVDAKPFSNVHSGSSVVSPLIQPLLLAFPIAFEEFRTCISVVVVLVETPHRLFTRIFARVDDCESIVSLSLFA